MDVHIPKAITTALLLAGVDVLTTQEDNTARLLDVDLLDRATNLERVLFTFDDDFLAEAAERQKESILFLGVIYAHPLRVSIGECIRDLEMIAKVAEPNELENRVEYLPL